jgi:hypothetical protein
MAHFTVSSSSPAVTIEPFDATAYPAFADVLARVRGVLRNVDERYSAVVTNVSARPIEAMVLRWTAAREKPRPSNRISDGFMNPPYRPVLAPGDRLLATRGMNLREDLPERFVAMSAGTGVEFADATHVQLDVDSVVLDDGSVTGDDRFGIVQHLRSRHQVIAELMEQCEAGLAIGRPVEEVAAAYENTYRDDPVRGRWVWQFARQLQRSEGFLPYLKRARLLPPNLGRREP